MATNPTNIGLWKGRGHREEAAWKLMSFAECPPPPPTPKTSLACRQHFFPPQQFAFRIFPLLWGQQRSRALIIFHGSAPQQSAILVGKVLLLCSNVETVFRLLRSRLCWLDLRCQSPPSGPYRVPHLRIPRSLLWKGNSNLGYIPYTQTIPIIIFFFKHSFSTQNKIFLS